MAVKVVKPASEGAGSTQKEERHEDKIDYVVATTLLSVSLMADQHGDREHRESG